MIEEKHEAEDKEVKLCTSVFMGEEKTTTKKIYTQKWVELINALERRK